MASAFADGHRIGSSRPAFGAQARARPDSGHNFADAAGERTLSFDSEPKYRSIPDQVADRLAVQIAMGKLVPGQRLIEVDISKEARVSRPPVREALRLLQAQGVVRTQPNRGTFVTDLTTDEFAEIFELRLAVEGAAVRRMMTQKLKLADAKERFADVMRDLQRAALLRDQLAFCQADIAFHERLVNLSESPLLVPAWQLLSRGLLIFLMRERERSFSYKEALADHERLLDLIASGEHEAIQSELNSHIMSTIEILRGVTGEASAQMAASQSATKARGPKAGSRKAKAS
jgi:DNA-binding GntR family transcriptional regulator